MKTDYALLLLKPSGFTGGSCTTTPPPSLLSWWGRHYISSVITQKTPSFLMNMLPLMLPNFRRIFGWLVCFKGMTLYHIIYLTCRKQTTMFLSFHFAIGSSLVTLSSVSCSKLAHNRDIDMDILEIYHTILPIPTRSAHNRATLYPY